MLKKSRASWKNWGPWWRLCSKTNTKPKRRILLQIIGSAAKNRIQSFPELLSEFNNIIKLLLIIRDHRIVEIL